jgi:beta-galactosidase
VELTNRQFFRGVSWLRATWEVAADGEVVARGELQLPDLPPGRTTSVNLSGWTLPSVSGGERWLTLRFRAAAGQAWAPEGFEICWAQVALDEPAAVGARLLDLEGQADDVHKDASGGPGGPVAVQLDEAGLPVHDLLAAGPRLCLWRAPTDNDRIEGLAADWREWGIAELRRTVRRIANEGAVAIVECDEVTGSGVAVRHSRRIEPLAGGGFRAEETVAVPEGLADLARVGMVLEAVPGLERVEWFGRGPVETYPDRRRGGAVGRWSSTATELFVPYVKPQENGGRADVRWLELSDGSSRGFRLTFDRPLQVSATHFRAQDLAEAKHATELAPRPETIVHFDVAHRGLGTASCGPDTLPEYRFGPGEYRWAWTLTPLR